MLKNIEIDLFCSFYNITELPWNRKRKFIHSFNQTVMDFVATETLVVTDIQIKEHVIQQVKSQTMHKWIAVFRCDLEEFFSTETEEFKLETSDLIEAASEIQARKGNNFTLIKLERIV